MKIGNRILNILDKNKVSHQDESRLSRLLSKDFGLNELEYKCWESELPLCRCGKYDTPSHFILSCKEIGRKYCIDILNQENIDRSLIMLINSDNDRAIMALVFLKHNSAFLDSSDN